MGEYRFSYSALPNKPEAAVTIDELFAAADEIHRYCRLEEPVVRMPRTQRVWADRGCRAFVHYPLGDTFTVTDDDDDITDDCEQVAPRLLAVPKDSRSRWLNVEGESGWGYTEEAEAFTSALAADQDEITVASASPIKTGWVLRLGDEMMVVVDRADTTITLLRGAGGTAAAAHEADASGVLSRVRPPALLEQAALGIARFISVRAHEPSRGVARPIQVQDGHRLVRSDPLATFRPDLQLYVR